MNENSYNILIVGIGGQGVLLASEIISEVGLNAGLDVKKSEIHGMSQRGGIVTSHVRLAPRVYSPTIERGQANILLAFEQAEALRALDWMAPEGTVIVSRTTLVPSIVTSSKEYTYPHDAIEQVVAKANRVIPVEADKIAEELGNPRLVNTILLGVMSNYLPFDKELWIDTLRKRVKEKFVEINLAAFECGRNITLATSRV